MEGNFGAGDPPPTSCLRLCVCVCVDVCVGTGFPVRQAPPASPSRQFYNLLFILYFINGRCSFFIDQCLIDGKAISGRETRPIQVDCGYAYAYVYVYECEYEYINVYVLMYVYVYAA